MKKKHLYIVISFILLLSIFNSFLSSPHPDGLERIAENHHFINRAQDSFSVLKDYSTTISNNFIGTASAGILGIILTTIILFGFGKILSSKK